MLWHKVQGAGGLDRPYDISNPIFEGSTSFSSYTTSNFGLHTSSNGEHIYLCSSSPRTIIQYTMSTPWDITTASYVRDVDLSGAVTTPVGVALSSDGTKLINYGAATTNQYDMFRQYNLSTAWNISTASLASTKENLGSFDINPRSVIIFNSGSTLLTVGAGTGTIRKWTLSTAYNVSTATQVQTYNDTWMVNTARAIAASEDGLKLLYLDSSDVMQELIMSSPLDLSTISLGDTFDPSTEDSQPLGIAFGDGGRRLYVAGRITNSFIEYSL